MEKLTPNRPVATHDLGKLLTRYKANKIFHETRRPDREWLRPVLCTAFGCLAIGLAYIHGRNLRHKDIKPDNILFEQTQSSQNPYDRFLWADFGLAYDFSGKKDRKTRNTKLYSPRYAPPEVAAANAREKINAVGKLTSVEENGETMLRADMNPKASDEESRTGDGFALGCIYLELLSRLVLQDLPLEANNDNKITFSDNIEGLSAWATKMKQEDCSADLRPLFDTAIAMIRPSPDERPGINEVIDEVMRAGRNFSCESCRSEHSTYKSTPSSPTTSNPLAPLQKQHSPVRKLGRISSGTTNSEREFMPLVRSKSAAPTVINDNQSDRL